MIRYTEPTEAHFEYLGEHARETDKQEVKDLTGRTDLAQLLKDSHKVSEECLVAEDSEGPVAIFGVSKEGVVWLIGTDRMRRYSEYLKGDAATILAFWRRRYGTLHNIVSSQNKVAIRWLKRLGFTIHEDQPYQAAVPFYPFNMEAHV